MSERVPTLEENPHDKMEIGSMVINRDCSELVREKAVNASANIVNVRVDSEELLPPLLP